MARTKRIRNYRNRIIQVASQLIIERGVAHTSLADIANAIGISKGTLYYYYHSKYDLIFDISERHMLDITNKILTWLEQSDNLRSPAEMLELVFKILLASETRGQIHTYLIQEALIGEQHLQQRFRDAYQTWTNMMMQGMKRVLEPKHDYSTLARLVIATLDGLLLQRLLKVPNIPLHDIARYLTDSNIVGSHEPDPVRTRRNR